MPEQQTHYSIRPLTDPLEIEKLESVQQAAWGFADREITPGSMLTASAHLGGLVAAAYPNDAAAPVGFYYGIPALRQGKLVHHSHMLAIVPEHRGSGLARALKIHQRDAALLLGYDTMTWTVDPMLARNARLNLGKLGVRAVEYKANWYAPSGGIYAGLAADRFMVLWDLKKESVEKPLGNIELKSVAVALDAGNHLVANLNLQNQKIFVELPTDLETLKREDLPKAKAWREAHRIVLPNYFSKNYVVTDFVRANDGRVFFELSRDA